MNLFLFRKAVLTSDLTETEIIERLSEIVNSKESGFSFFYNDQTKKYTGKIENKRFKIHKIIKGRNSFIPIINGEIIDNISTRKIELTMRPHFLLILFLFGAFAFALYHLINDKNYDGLFFLGLLFGMIILFFNIESHESTKDLQDILLTSSDKF